MHSAGNLGGKYMRGTGVGRRGAVHLVDDQVVVGLWIFWTLWGRRIRAHSGCNAAKLRYSRSASSPLPSSSGDRSADGGPERSDKQEATCKRKRMLTAYHVLALSCSCSRTSVVPVSTWDTRSLAENRRGPRCLHACVGQRRPTSWQLWRTLSSGCR